MKNETRKNIEALLGWAEKAKGIFAQAGEQEFDELRKKEKIALVKALEDTGLEIIEDGDSDGISKAVKVEDDGLLIAVEFFSGEYYHEDFNDDITTLQVYVNKYLDRDDDCQNIRDFADALEQIISIKTNIVNLTPHEITFYAADGATITGSIPSSGIARAEQTREEIGKINGISVNTTRYGEVVDLPEPQENTIYIVSVITAQAAKDRRDLYIVDDVVRDDAGRILGCKALAQIN